MAEGIGNQRIGYDLAALWWRASASRWCQSVGGTVGFVEEWLGGARHGTVRCVTAPPIELRALGARLLSEGIPPVARAYTEP